MRILRITRIAPAELRRATIRPLTALLLVAALCWVSLGVGPCKTDPNKPTTKEQGIAFAKDIASGLRSAQPLVAQLNPKAGELLATGIPIADQIITAVGKGDAVTVVALLNDLLPIVNQVVGQFTSNIKVLTFMALADIGIHFLINHAPEIFGTADMQQLALRANRPGDPANAIRAYAQRPAWGCQYHEEKCRQLN